MTFFIKPWKTIQCLIKALIMHYRIDLYRKFFSLYTMHNQHNHCSPLCVELACGAAFPPVNKSSSAHTDSFTPTASPPWERTAVVVHKQINAPINDLSGFACERYFPFFFFFSPDSSLYVCLTLVPRRPLLATHTLSEFAYTGMICRYSRPVNACYVTGTHYFGSRGLNAMPVSR